MQSSPSRRIAVTSQFWMCSTPLGLESFLMKIRTHLLMMPVVSLVPLLLFAAVAFKHLLDAERAAALRSVQEVARVTSIAVDRDWAHAEGVARALGTSVVLANGDFGSVFEQARKATAGRELNIALQDSRGLQIFNTAVPFGDKIAPPDPTIADEIAQILKEGVPRVSDVIRGSATGRLVVAMRVPVQASQTTSYLVSPWFYAETLQRAFVNTANSPEMLVALFDRKGRTIAINRGPAKLLGEFPREDLLHAILNKQTTALRNESRGGERLYTMLSRSAATGWTVAVGVPQRQVEAAARQAVWLTGAGLVLAFALAFFGAAFYGQRLVRAMGAAARSAQWVGQGKVPPQTVSGVDEMDQVQSALRDAGELLVRTEAERSKLLFQAEAARNEAEHANRAKDEFLAMLSHELRNPLSAITGGLSILEHPSATGDMRLHAHDIVRRQCGRLTSIVDELLDASRVRTGKVSLLRKRVDLAEIARSSAEAVQMSGASNRHTLQVKTETAWVDGDPIRLAQIVTNLLENALKYTPDGGHVELSVAADPHEAVLVVRDNGVGIAPELLSHVFDVFMQGPTSLDRSKGGLGIGLAVVLAMVEQHDGRVVAESAGEGLGSCFTVRLPLLPDQTGTAVGGAAAPVVQRDRGRRILVVDDNEDARTSLVRFLMLEGIDVLEARDGAEALRIATTDLPQVAVIDIGLRDIDGYEVARQLRLDPRTREMRLVALTGYGLEADQQRARAAGFDRHFTKPVELADLLAAI